MYLNDEGSLTIKLLNLIKKWLKKTENLSIKENY